MTDCNEGAKQERQERQGMSECSDRSSTSSAPTTPEGAPKGMPDREDEFEIEDTSQEKKDMDETIEMITAAVAEEEAAAKAREERQREVAIFGEKAVKEDEEAKRRIQGWQIPGSRRPDEDEDADEERGDSHPKEKSGENGITRHEGSGDGEEYYRATQGSKEYMETTQRIHRDAMRTRETEKEEDDTNNDGKKPHKKGGSRKDATPRKGKTQHGGESAQTDANKRMKRDGKEGEASQTGGNKQKRHDGKAEETGKTHTQKRRRQEGRMTSKMGGEEEPDASLKPEGEEEPGTSLKTMATKDGKTEKRRATDTSSTRMEMQEDGTRDKEKKTKTRGRGGKGETQDTWNTWTSSNMNSTNKTAGKRRRDRTPETPSTKNTSRTPTQDRMMEKRDRGTSGQTYGKETQEKTTKRTQHPGQTSGKTTTERKAAATNKRHISTACSGKKQTEETKSKHKQGQEDTTAGSATSARGQSKKTRMATGTHKKKEEGGERDGATSRSQEKEMKDGNTPRDRREEPEQHTERQETMAEAQAGKEEARQDPTMNQKQMDTTGGGSTPKCPHGNKETRCQDCRKMTDRAIAQLWEKIGETEEKGRRQQERQETRRRAETGHGTGAHPREKINQLHKGLQQLQNIRRGSAKGDNNAKTRHKEDERRTQSRPKAQDFFEEPNKGTPPTKQGGGGHGTHQTRTPPHKSRDSGKEGGETVETTDGKEGKLEGMKSKSPSKPVRTELARLQRIVTKLQATTEITDGEGKTPPTATELENRIKHIARAMGKARDEREETTRTVERAREDRNELAMKGWEYEKQIGKTERGLKELREIVNRMSETIQELVRRTDATERKVEQLENEIGQEQDSQREPESQQ